MTKNKVWIQSTENWLPSQRSLRYQKDNFRSFIYGQSSTIRANFIEIGQVDVEIIGLKEITKNIKKHDQNMQPTFGFLKAGWLKYYIYKYKTETQT